MGNDDREDRHNPLGGSPFQFTPPFGIDLNVSFGVGSPGM